MPGGMPGKDRGTGCTLRSVGVSGFFQQGSAGTRAREDCKEILLLTLGRRGGAPHQLPRSGSSTSPAGLASCAEKKQASLALQTDLPSIDGGFHLRRQRFVS